VGLRGIRIQNIVNELNGEKIDVVQWDADPATFIANALSPAQVESVTINTAENVAVVVVPDRQLSLAIGREGQNARLAAKLTGWRIDIKSTSIALAEKAAKDKTILETSEEPSTDEETTEAVIETPPAAAQKKVKEAAAIAKAEQPAAAPSGKKDEFVDIITLEKEAEEELLTPEEPDIEYAEEPKKEALVSSAGPQAPVIRFAEDLLPRHSGKIEKKGKKGKKAKARVDDVIKVAPKPKPRRAADLPIYDEDFELELLKKAEEKAVDDENDKALEDDIFVENASKPQKKVKKQVKSTEGKA
jgi:N utilization substance protein A